MRLIGTFETEKEAYAFYFFLLKQGIQNIYEAHTDPEKERKEYFLWIYDEEDFQTASDWLNHYKQNPQDPQFHTADPPIAPASATAYRETGEEEESKWQSPPIARIQTFKRRITWIHILISLCVVLFFWDNVQRERIEESKGRLAVYFAHTPLEQRLLFDYPASLEHLDAVVALHSFKDAQELSELAQSTQEALYKAEQIPSWKGIYPFFLTAKNKGLAQAATVALFEKIRQGEYWRLFTPCLLHYDYLHILFNMSWLWILGKQIQERIRSWKMGVMILIIGVVSNMAQYLMSGPSFLGISGVIVGMAGFIWMRQRLAPWEGYPLSRATFFFLMLFVLAMAAIGFITFALHLFSLIEISPVIANTAHIAGGVCGILLGRSSFFARGKLV